MEIHLATAIDADTLEGNSHSQVMAYKDVLNKIDEANNTANAVFNQVFFVPDGNQQQIISSVETRGKLHELETQLAEIRALMTDCVLSNPVLLNEGDCDDTVNTDADKKTADTLAQMQSILNSLNAAQELIRGAQSDIHLERLEVDADQIRNAKSNIDNTSKQIHGLLVDIEHTSAVSDLVRLSEMASCLGGPDGDMQEFVDLAQAIARRVAYYYDINPPNTEAYTDLPPLQVNSGEVSDLQGRMSHLVEILTILTPHNGTSGIGSLAAIEAHQNVMALVELHAVRAELDVQPVDARELDET